MKQYQLEERVCEICGKSYISSQYQIHHLCGDQKCINKRFVNTPIPGDFVAKAEENRISGEIHTRNHNVYVEEMTRQDILHKPASVPTCSERRGIARKKTPAQRRVRRDEFDAKREEMIAKIRAARANGETYTFQEGL